MRRSEAEILVAVALWQAGRLTLSACNFAVDRAALMPDFRCQEIRNWKMPAARSVCVCGNEMERSFGPCVQCRQEHAALYLSNGRRRIVGPGENE